jgi:homoserine O-acetyltransferase/O-succinyltransferase
MSVSDPVPGLEGDRAVVELTRGLPLEREDPIPRCRIGYEWIGNPEGPVVVALGGISADGHVTPHAAHGVAGWWERLVGPGRALDTRRVRVVGIDWIGGPGRSSAPARRPGPGGIPAVTTGDQAAALAAVLDHLGVERAPAVVGASYGAMVALSFGARFPERAGRILAISGAHESHPMATALRSLQRRIALLAHARGATREGLVLARSLAMTTYRSPEEFRERFDMEPRYEPGGFRFPVEDYLEHHGRRFAERFELDHFLYLNQSLDLHRVEPEAIETPAILLAVAEDALVPLWQMRELHRRLGAPGELVEISSPMAHDAFLVEEDSVGSVVRRVMEEAAEGGPAR